MTKDEIIQQTKRLDLPRGSFIVFGSCPLAAVGLREANDIDMLVSPEQFTAFEKAGWKLVNKGVDDNPLAKGDFEVHQSWSFSSYNPTLEELLSRADYFDGIPFASLEDVRKWKAASGRPKDLADIQLIDDYLKKNA